MQVFLLKGVLRSVMTDRQTDRQTDGIACIELGVGRQYRFLATTFGNVASEKGKCK